jgi:hypothetical protein
VDDLLECFVVRLGRVSASSGKHFELGPTWKIFKNMDNCANDARRD